jgi:hypothetical protein
MKINIILLSILSIAYSLNVFSQDGDKSLNFGEGIPLQFEGFVQQDLGYKFSGAFFSNKYKVDLGDSIQLNWNFSGNSTPSSVDINNIYQNDLSVGSATAAPRENTTYTITASNTYHTLVLDLDVIVQDWTLTDSTWSNWLNYGSGYDYGNWFPNLSSQTTNFDQNRNYSQRQRRARFEREIDSINSVYRFTGNNEIEERIVNEGESRLITTTFSNFIPGNIISTGSWSPSTISRVPSISTFGQTRNVSRMSSRQITYTEPQGNIIGTGTDSRPMNYSEGRSITGNLSQSFIRQTCGSYSPSPSTVDEGQSFNQTARCTNYYNNRYSYSTGESYDREVTSFSGNQNRISVGTKDTRECIGGGHSQKPVPFGSRVREWYKGSFVQITSDGRVNFWWKNNEIGNKNQGNSDRTNQGWIYSIGQNYVNTRYTIITFGSPSKTINVSLNFICRKPI